VSRLVIGVGTAATIAGAVLLLTPLSVPIEPPVVPTLGAVALLGLVAGAVGAVDRSTDRPEPTSLPDPTGRVEVDAPGDAFDRRLATVSAQGDDDRRESIRERLEAAAVATIGDAEGCPPEAARRRLERGDWTDDEAAAAFFADGIDPTPPLRERLRRAAAGEPTFAHRADRVVDELADVDDR